MPKLFKWEFKSISKIWKYELIIAGLLLAIFFGFDLWVYFIKAEANRNFSPEPDASKVISLKEDKLKSLDKKIQEYKDFLKNPKFTY